MEWVETTGKTLDEAREAALDELGVDAQDAEFEVLSEPKLGLFGRVRTEGRVRARVRPSVPRAKEDRRDRRRRSRSGDKGGGDKSGGDTSEAPDSGESSSEQTTASRGPSRRSRGGSQRKAATAPTPDTETDSPASAPAAGRRNPSRTRTAAATVESDTVTTVSVPAPADPSTADRPDTTSSHTSPTSTTESSGTGRNGGSRRSRGAASERTDGRRQTADDTNRRRPAEDDTRGDESVDVPLDEQGQVAERFLTGLFDAFGSPATISLAQPDDDTLELNVSGDNLGLLIGPKGATLLALQELTRAAVQRQTGAGNGRINVDIAGYRHHRADALAQFARKVAADVVGSGNRVALEPMAAADRKVVHDALTEVAGVQTTSEGEDPRRRVVILPVG